MTAADQSTSSSHTAPRIARTAKSKRPQYFADPATDKLLAMVVTLMGERAVTRDRLDAVERLLDQHGLLARAAVEGYVPTESAAAERETRRAATTARVLRILEAQLDEITRRDLGASQEEILGNF